MVEAQEDRSGRTGRSGGPRGRAARLLGCAVAALALLGFYLVTGFGLAGDTDLRRHPSGLYDMDVARVVADLTSDRPAYRASVHPLQKLLLAPLGSAIADAVARVRDGAAGAGRGGDARDGLVAARLMIALAMTLQALATGVLAWWLSRRSLTAALCAAALLGVSFASVLAASIPESAVFAGLAGLLPLVALEVRWGRPFGGGEAALWAGLSALAFGLTVTQVIPVWIALGVRLFVAAPEASAPEAAGQGARRAGALRFATVVAAAALLVAAGVEVQRRTHPGTPAFYALDPIAGEAPYLRTSEALAVPLRHTARLAAHFAVYDFVAPMPAPSDFLLRDGLDYWSLSVEAARARHWRAGQRALAVAVLAAVLAAAVLCARRDPHLLAPALCVAAHFALHWLYGREYVLYAPHWHGTLVALLVAGAWNALGARRRLVPAAAALLVAGMAANDLVVMRAAYREASAGLSVDARDATGRLRATPRPGPGAREPDRSGTSRRRSGVAHLKRSRAFGTPLVPSRNRFAPHPPTGRTR